MHLRVFWRAGLVLTCLAWWVVDNQKHPHFLQEKKRITFYLLRPKTVTCRLGPSHLFKRWKIKRSSKQEEGSIQRNLDSTIQKEKILINGLNLAQIIITTIKRNMVLLGIKLPESMNIKVHSEVKKDLLQYSEINNLEIVHI